MHLSEFVHQEPAHRVGARLPLLQATDAKSLFDAVCSPNTVTNDKRTMVSIRTIQESVPNESMRWVPTRFQFSDGLTKVEDKLRNVFTKWLQNPVAILVEHPENTKFEEEYFGSPLAPHEKFGQQAPKYQKNNTGVNFVHFHSYMP